MSKPIKGYSESEMWEQRVVLYIETDPLSDIYAQVLLNDLTYAKLTEFISSELTQNGNNLPVDLEHTIEIENVVHIQKF